MWLSEISTDAFMTLSTEQPGAGAESWNGCSDSKWLEADHGSSLFPLLLAAERRVCVGAALSHRPTISSG